MRALAFLTNTVFTCYILCVMLRFFLQWVKADFYNPLCQLLIKLTNPLLVPLRRLTPGFFGVDFAAIILMLLLGAINVALLTVITGLPWSSYLILVTINKLVTLMLNMYFFAIIIRSIMSWVNPAPHNPIYMILGQLTEPVLRPIRRVIPMIHGFDLSPIVALLALHLISILFQT